MRRSLIFLARAAAVVAAAFAIDHFCIRPYRGAVVEVEVQQRSAVAETADHQRAVIIVRDNLRDLDRVAPDRRLDASWYMLYGGNLALIDRWPEATDVYTRALAIDRRPEIYFNRGLGRLHLGQLDAGVADMATAARFNPYLLEQIDGELRARVAAAAGLK
jgi:tetratricopeptide (TPR) repeat protein